MSKSNDIVFYIMRFVSLFHKIGMYILSMWLLSLIVVILSLNLPFEFGGEFIGFRQMVHHPWLTSIFLVFFIAAIVYYFVLKEELSSTQQFSVEITEISSKQSDPLAFLASYFVPLVSFQLDIPSHEIVLILLFIVIGVMYVKGGLFHMNPTLLLLGFKMYDVEYAKDGHNYHVVAISESTLNKGNRIRHIKISNDIWFAYKK